MLHHITPGNRRPDPFFFSIMDSYGKSPQPENLAQRDPDLSWRWLPSSPLAQLTAAAIATIAGLVLLLWALNGQQWNMTVLWGSAFYLGAVSLAGFALHPSYPHRVIGLCNLVTLFRLMLTSVLFAALFAPDPSAWMVFSIAALAFLLDGADGWLARRSGLVSQFGARFDMEVDSAFALILAIHAFQNGMSPLVLLLGLPRYAFGLAQFTMPFLSGPLPNRFSRKAVCVLQISALLILILPWAEPPLAHLVAGLTALALAWSFAIDIRALWRAKS